MGMACASEQQQPFAIWLITFFLLPVFFITLIDIIDFLRQHWHSVRPTMEEGSFLMDSPWETYQSHNYPDRFEDRIFPSPSSASLLIR